MKKRRTSYAFLMEMLWVCGFFALAACIFVLAFVKAEHLSRSAEHLNQAVLVSQNAVETALSRYDTEGTASSDGTEIHYYDRDWILTESETEAAFVMRLSSQRDEALLTVTATVSKADGEIIYDLEASRNLAKISPYNGSHTENQTAQAAQTGMDSTEGRQP